MRTHGVSRRDFLDQLSRRAAALALTSLFGDTRAGAADTSARAEPPAGIYPFTLGVASGVPRPDSVVLWTRLSPRPHEPGGGLPDAALTVHWELAEDERFSRGLRRGSVQVRPEHGHSLHVEVGGLASAAAFFYRFMTRDAISPVGRTRTAPAAGVRVDLLRIALASCQHFEQGSFAAHREIARRDLDFVLFVGDYIYESSNPRWQVRRHEGPTPVSLDGYRARHATYKLDPDLRAAHAAHPWVLTWDDHEVENDYANDISASGMTASAFLQRRAFAYKAYFEHMPVSPALAPHAAAMRIHDRYEWGDLAELWTLDNRQFRDPAACASAGGDAGLACAALDDPRRSLFGADQERWLANGLATSGRRWKLLGQGSQISSGRPDASSGRRLNLDGWDGYPAARARLYGAMARSPAGDVLCLGGDVHRNVAADLRLQPGDERSPIVASEFVCTSVSSHGGSAASGARWLAANPDIVHARGDERGYAWLELNRQRALCEFRTTASPAGDAARFSTQARFTVESGRAGVLRG